MKQSLFVDTGPFYARYVARDTHHEEAKSLWEGIRQRGIRCVTSNFVLSELITLLVYRFGAGSALHAAREIYGSNAVQIVTVTTDLELKGLEWLERFAEQNFSMTDAVTFALMKERNLVVAFTFDRHFDIAGFQPFSG